MKVSISWRSLFVLVLVSIPLLLGAARDVFSSENLQVWSYVETTAAQEAKERKIEGVSYLAAGAVAATIPFVATSAGGTLRTAGTYTLLPLGILSVAYGTYTLATDSEWEKIRNRVENLSGEKEASVQWGLRREAHSRQVLLERVDKAKFWRYFWGGVEAGSGLAILRSDPDTFGVIAASALFGLSLYHFLYRTSDERVSDQLDHLSLGILPDGGSMLAFSFLF